jgi:Phosphotransferase enzyme family
MANAPVPQAITDKLGMVADIGRIATAILWERLGPAPRLQSAAVVPPSAQTITADWLTKVLCRDVPGAQVVSVEMIDGHNGTSARRALALRYNAAGAAAQLPTRLFSKSTATFGSRLLLGITGITEGEATFYTVVRNGLELRSPHAYYAGYDPKSHRSMVLLEDLRERHWTFPEPMNNPVTRSDAEDMVAEMAAYHGALWDSPRFNTDLKRLRPADAWQETLNRKVSFAKRTLTGLERAKDVVPEAFYAQRNRLYPAFMQSLALHSSSPATLLHQDLHLGNWLRDDTGRMGLYDWQCVACGNWALDYSYALAGALTTGDRREWQEDLLKLYLILLRESGASSVPSFDEAWLAYRQQCMHGVVFGLFTLGGSRFEPELQPRDYTLAAIERITRHATDLDAIGALLA